MWEWILRVWRNIQRKIKLDQGKFIDMCPLNRDLKFNSIDWQIRKGFNSLFGLSKDWKVAQSEWARKARPAMVYCRGSNSKAKHIRMLEWISHLRPLTHAHRVQKTHLSPWLVRSNFVSRAPASLKSYVIAFFWRLDLTMGTGVTGLGHWIGNNWILGWQEPSGATQLPNAGWVWLL